MFGFVEFEPSVCAGRRMKKLHRSKSVHRASLYHDESKNRIYKISLIRMPDGSEFDGFCEKYHALNGRLLVPENTVLRDDIKAMLYSPDKYEKHLLALSALDLITCACSNRFRCNIAVIDRGGKFADQLERFLPYCNRIDVITNRLSFYMQIADRLYRQCGAAIAVGSDGTRLHSAHAVIAADIGDENFSACKKIICIGKTGISHALTVASVCPDNGIDVPSGIDSIRFAGALAELNGDQNAERACACSYRFGGKMISRAAAIEYMTIT